MSDALGPEARALIARVRRRDGPDAGDRERLRSKLEPVWASERRRVLDAANGRQALPRRGLAKLSTLLLASLGLWQAGPSHTREPLPAAPTAGGAPIARSEHSLASSRELADGTPAAPSPEVTSSAQRDAAAGNPARAALAATESDARRRGARHTAADMTSSTRGGMSPRRRNVPQPDPLLAREHAATSAHASWEPPTVPREQTPQPRARTEGRPSAAQRSEPGKAPQARARPRVLTLAETERTPHASEHPEAAVAPSVREDGFAPQPIDDELAWLGAAQEALRKQQPARALQLVQEHAFRFPAGALAPERSAVHALALCALSRKRAAYTVLRELERRAPASPLLDRVRRGCGLL